MTAAKKTTITQRFDRAASGYDEAAKVQAEAAQHLVNWAMPQKSPSSILDIGTGTGLVAAAIARRWPATTITALDSAPNMLSRARQKLPKLKIISGDAMHVDLEPGFDAIFCSMLLHWLPDPRAALERWRVWLRPGGRLYAALLVEGSFDEWRELCKTEGAKDGLWAMPPARFAEDLVLRSERQCVPAVYPSALDFLRQLKATGASTPRDGHEPANIRAMRHLLRRAARPFTASFETFYIELPSSSI